MDRGVRNVFVLKNGWTVWNNGAFRWRRPAVGEPFVRSRQSLRGVRQVKTVTLGFACMCRASFCSQLRQDFAPGGFASIIKDYRLLPDERSIRGKYPAWLELILGGLLLAGKWLERLVPVMRWMLVFWPPGRERRSRHRHRVRLFLHGQGKRRNMTWYIFRGLFFVLLRLAAWYVCVFRNKFIRQDSSQYVHDSL
jgi:hypothetical protein